MQRFILSACIGLFGIILFEMCRELANRNYYLFGLKEVSPDFVVNAGIISLAFLLLCTVVLNKGKIKN